MLTSNRVPDARAFDSLASVRSGRSVAFRVSMLTFFLSFFKLAYLVRQSCRDVRVSTEQLEFVGRLQFFAGPFT